ncbi:MAG: RHS repeat-associated core domain-containing protein [Pseudomonadota bacterium]
MEGTGWIQSGSGESVSAYWNGRDSQGKELPPGTYAITLTTQTEGGTCNGNTIQRTTTINVTANPIQCLLVEGGSLVNVASGNLNHSQALFRLPNAKFKGEFSLVYNSFDGRLTPLGQGWTHAYNIKLLANNDGSYTLIEGDGQKTALYSNGSRYTPQKSNYPALTKYSDNSYTLEHKNGLSYHFNPYRIITSITDRNSNALVFSYDAGNNLTGIMDSSGRSTVLQYDSNNRINRIFDPMGNSHYFTYSGQTLTALSSQINGLGIQNWAYTYDENGFMLTRTDPGGYVTSYGYDSDHRLNRSIDPQGKTRTMAYNPSQNSTQITEKDGGLWIYTYDAEIGALTGKTDPLGNATQYFYDSQWNLAVVTDPRGNGTWYTYDANGNTASTTDSLGNMTSYTYNALNKITTIGYPGNVTVGLTYDTHGNLTSTTDSMNNVTQYGYDSRGNLTTITNALNQTTTLRYNPNNYLTAITDPAAATTSFTYDSAGNLLTQTDPLNNTVGFQYNGLNKVIRITDPLGQVTDFGYDLNGNLISRTDGNGNVTQYQYNDKGQVLQITDALSQITRFTYGSGCPACGSGGDRLTSLIDAKGQTTSFEYNPAGKLIKETNPLGDVKTYTYDGAGNRVTMTDEYNRTTQYTYDILNRLMQVLYPDGTAKTFGYDVRGNITSAANSTISYSLTYDRNNRLTQVMGDKTIQYQYDAGNRKTQMITPDGRTITYGYDAADRLIRLTSNLGIFNFSYDKAGRRVSLTYPNKVATTFMYNPVGYVTSLQTRTWLKLPVNSFSYTYDAVGNRTALKGLLGSHTYSYDPLYQLTQASHLLLPTENFSYDPTGNRSNTTVQADNSLLEDDHFLYSYDPTGNLIQKTDKAGGEKTSYTYDNENKLIKIEHPGLVARYKYDPFGRRIEKEVNGKISRYVYDKENIIAEYDGSGNIRARYTHNLMLDDPLAVEQGGKTYYYHKDGLGSVAELTNSLGMVVKSYRYKSFGERVFLFELGPLHQPYTFTSREYDPESGFYYYRARYYDPKAGRFISRDPIGFQGGDTNFYRYVGNNPVNWVDPLGLVNVGQTVTGFLQAADAITMAGIALAVPVGTFYLTGNPILTSIVATEMLPVWWAAYLETTHAWQNIYEGLKDKPYLAKPKRPCQ